MSLTYKKLFEININHDYYSGLSDGLFNIHNDLEIFPDNPTKKILQDYRLRMIKTSSGLIIVASATPIDPTDLSLGYKTKIAITEQIKFNFFIRIKNVFFSNFTNTRLITGENQFYYFNNLSENIATVDVDGTATDLCYLSQALPEYPSLYPDETIYQLGDLFVDSGGVNYEAITNFTPPGLGPSPTDTNNANWEVIGNTFQYISPLDLVDTNGSFFNYQADNDNPGEVVTFSLQDVHSQAINFFDSPKTSRPVNPIQAPTNASDDIIHQLDLRFLKQGIYQINASHSLSAINQDFNFFLYDRLAYPGVFGTLEIFAGDQVPSAYQFINNQIISGQPVSEIQEKTYDLRFKNRMTLWQYQQADGSLLAISNNRPRPLQKIPTAFTSDGDLLPDPNIYKIIPERNTVDTQLIDNIYSKTYI